MFHKSEEGFSIIEILVAMVITTISAGAIMYGVVTIRKHTDELTTKEKAFDQLANYTEVWKSKISAGQWDPTDGWDDEDQFDLVPKPKGAIRATLSRKGGVVNGDFPYPLYSLETKITWLNDGNPNEMNLKVFQIEF